MKILNFGSLNIDFVYHVVNFVKPGETISALSYERFCGGKGLNQSIALARAGANVLHAGKIGRDGAFLRDKLLESGVDCSSLEFSETDATGHAVIQVSGNGENCIVLYGGANRKISQEQIEKTLAKTTPGDFLLLQNEINSLPEIIRIAHKKGLRIFFNPAPMNDAVLDCPLDSIDTFILNETEAAGISGLPDDTQPEIILAKLREKFPNADLLITLGSAGAMFGEHGKDTVVRVPAASVKKVVDTTAAGDTFIGYFLADTASGKTPEEAMKTAVRAAAFCVERPGAADSIPFRNQLQ